MTGTPEPARRRHIRSRVAGALAATLWLSATPAPAHENDAGLRSTLQSLRPGAAGLEARVLNDEVLELSNRSGRTVVVEGYEGEPYLRLRADGTVQINSRSPAAYLNEDRYARVTVPAGADPDAAPEWSRVADGGTVAWYDHRIHSTSTHLPPEVEDEHVATHVRDWRVPLRVGGRTGAITGSLDWRPPPHRASVALPIASGLSVLGIGSILVARRRRRVA